MFEIALVFIVVAVVVAVLGVRGGAVKDGPTTMGTQHYVQQLAHREKRLRADLDHTRFDRHHLHVHRH